MLAKLDYLALCRSIQVLALLTDSDAKDVEVLDQRPAARQFSPDRRTLATGSDDKTVILWDLTRLNALRGDPVEHACALTGRGLHRDEWTAYIPGLSYENTCPDRS